MINEISLTEDMVLNKIYQIRMRKVMLDRDLANFYGVPTKVFNQAVSRNIHRFPEDFMFRLSGNEFKILRSQFVTSSWGGTRYTPRAFTEQGVAMLSSVLNSEQAIRVNIQIIRIFSRMRTLLLTHKDLLLRIEIFEKRLDNQETDLKSLFHQLKQLVQENGTARTPIGF